MEMSTCLTCGKEYPATKDFFCVDKRNKSGIYRRCRECSKIKARESHLRNIDSKIAYRTLNRDKINAKKRQHYLENRERLDAEHKQWRIDNPEKTKQISARARDKNRDKINLASRERYQRIKSHHSELTRRWKQEHKDLRNIHWQNRRAKEASAVSDLTLEQWESAKKYFENKCAYCGKDEKLTQDHFIPISLNGDHTHSNVIPCCLSCNCSKSTKNFSEWYPTYRFYDVERQEKIYNYINKATL